MNPSDAQALPFPSLLEFWYVSGLACGLIVALVGLVKSNSRMLRSGLTLTIIWLGVFQAIPIVLSLARGRTTSRELVLGSLILLFFGLIIVLFPRMLWRTRARSTPEKVLACAQERP